MNMKSFLFGKSAVRNKFVFQRFWMASFFVTFLCLIFYGCVSLHENSNEISAFQLKNYIYEYLNDYVLENDLSGFVLDCELQEISIEVAERGCTDGETAFRELVDVISNFEFFEQEISFEFLSLDDFLLNWPLIHIDENPEM